MTVLLHKPRGVVTGRRTAIPDGPKTAYDLVRDAGPPAARRSAVSISASSGLLLFTTDTRLSAALTDPGATPSHASTS